MEAAGAFVRSRVWVRGIVLFAVIAACGPTPALRAVMPAPGPLPRRDADAKNRACESCHEDVARTWRGSMHAQAFTDPMFQRSLAREPAQFCRDCHAPERDATAIGVSCVTCHDPAGRGEVLAAPREAAKRAPHAVRREAAFAGTAACAGCHEFPFPDADRRGRDGAQMQRTVSEHRASRFADRSCAACHMQRDGGSARSHAFVPDLSSAVLARASRSDDRLVVDLTAGEIGHAFPTGDLFRRLLVVGEVVGEDYHLLARVERPLGRHFRFEAGDGGAGVQRETGDDRVGVSGTRVELVLGERARGHDVVWRVEYQRVENMIGPEADVASRVVVAEGRLSGGAP